MFLNNLNLYYYKYSRSIQGQYNSLVAWLLKKLKFFSNVKLYIQVPGYTYCLLIYSMSKVNINLCLLIGICYNLTQSILNKCINLKCTTQIKF